MYRAAFHFLMLVSLTTTALSEERFFGTEEIQPAMGKVRGEAVIVIVGYEKALASPDWQPDSGEDPPLAIRESVRLAKKAIAKNYPEMNHSKWSVSVSLRRYTFYNSRRMISDGLDVPIPSPASRYVYRVRFADMADDEATDIPIAVLLDGTVIKPTVLRRLLNSLDEPPDAPETSGDSSGIR